jgi:hypothetical protein
MMAKVGQAMRRTIPMILLAVLVAGCETRVDPATGQAQTAWTLPFTAASAARAQQQWADCIQFRSESYCERNLPQGRPPNTPSAGQPGLGAAGLNDYPVRRDP